MDDFTVELDPRDVEPFDPLAFSDPPAGAHKVIVKAFEKHVKTGDGMERVSAKHIVQISEGDHAGRLVTLYLGCDMSKDVNRKKWIAGLLSVGYQRAQLQKDKITIGAKTFVGKSAFIWVDAAPEGEIDETGRKKLANTTYVAPEQYARLLDMPVGADTKKNGRRAVSPVPQPAAQPMAESDVF